MDILIIGTGSEIPPKGWGAVEAIITEHITRLPKFNVNVDLINTLNWWDLALMINEQKKKYDFVHAHYDIMFPYLKAACNKNVTLSTAMTSHFPYITNEEMYSGFQYWKVMNYFLDDQHDHLNFCISDRDISYFKSKGVSPERLFRLKLGASESINFTDKPEFYDKTIYLGKICSRKRQEFYGGIKSIDFAGNVSGEDPNANPSNLNSYLGEWSKDQVYENLTKYANLALLSHGENTPLVVREALIAGCGIVVSESSSNELDVNMPFIDVIPDDKLDDIQFVENILAQNREKSTHIRDDIRAYGIEEFGWDSCVKHYISEIHRALGQ